MATASRILAVPLARLAALGLALPVDSAAQSALTAAGASAPIEAVATRVEPGVALKIDGRLTEPVWQSAAPIAALRQQEPDEGAAPTEDTEVRLLFDNSTLYIGVLARDREPDRIIARIRQRDRVMELDSEGRLKFGGDDAVAVLIDGFHDRRNAIVLATNPNGAEFDAQISDEGREINPNWRGLWSVSASRTADGWSAEFAIPFRSLRYRTSRAADARTWGFNVYRVIRRKNEHVLWRAWRRGSEGFTRVSLAGDLAGVNPGRGRGRPFYFKPYALARANHAGGTDPDGSADAGLDFKYEVRPGLVLDATLNTDFAQADVDDEQVNLTRFGLFLPEKREFFLENSGIFEFGARGNGETPPFLMFFSRRIGITDSGPVPLLGGVRLSGRAGRQTVGLLHVVTDRAFGQAREPNTVARIKRDLGRAGYVGAMVTRAGRPDSTNAVWGIDWSVWPAATFNLQGFVARTATGGVIGSDNTYRLGVDLQQKTVGFNGDHIYLGPETRADLGFVTRADVRRTNGLLRLTARPGRFGIRRVDFMNLGRVITRADGEFQDWVAGPALGIDWASGDNMNPYFITGRTRITQPFSLGGRVTVPVGEYRASDLGLILTVTPARPVSGSAYLLHQWAYGGRIASANLTARAAAGARVVLELGLVHSDVRLPAGRFVANVGSWRLGYTFSTKLLTSVRLQYNALERRLISTARLEYRYRPGSELFVVLEDGRPGQSGLSGSQRAATVKLTWLR